jgi:hypothetical protein
VYSSDCCEGNDKV